MIGLKDFNTKDLWLGLNFEVRAPSAVVLAYRTRNSIKFGDGRVILQKSIILLYEFYSCLREKDQTLRWELGDATLTVKTLARNINLLLELNCFRIKQIPQGHRIADSQFGAASGRVVGSRGHQL